MSKNMNSRCKSIGYCDNREKSMHDVICQEEKRLHETQNFSIFSRSEMFELVHSLF